MNDGQVTIMVVDDTPDNLKLLQEMLEIKGYYVLASPDGKMALNAAATNPPDLILLDIIMPEMDGFEVCERLKADPALREIPVLFISALDQTADKVKAFAVGGVDYVTKPFEFEEVHARVETHLKIRSLQRQLTAQNENLDRLVTERTQELARAYERLLELDRLKDDFMRMISHEIRTPANGVLGIGETLIDLCPASDDCTLYSDLFRQSGLRLSNLIEDATMIADMANAPPKSGADISFLVLLDEVRASLPEINVAVVQQRIREQVYPQGDSSLLKRALETMILLSAAFSRDKKTAQIVVSFDEGVLRVRLAVDNLSLSGEQAVGFFETGSSARAASTAEALGLAPVVADKIISAFGGKMKLVKEEGQSGYLEAILICHP